jgi:tetratricopeptide (TPR) repeat protein
LAEKAVGLAANNAWFRHTLGVAHYRAGNWKAALDVLGQNLDLRDGGDSYDWFFLAMASWNLGERERARRWYAAARLRMDRQGPGDEELRRFRAEAAALLGVPEWPAQDGPPAGKDDLALDTLLVELVPGAPWAHSRRALAYCRLGRWDKAALDYAELLKARPDDLECWREYASVLLLQGDRDGYRRVCEGVQERFGRGQGANEPYLLALTLSLAPNGAAEPAQVVEQAQKAVAAHPKAGWYRHALALAHYRAGNFAEADRQCKQSIADDPAWGGHVVNWLLLALAQQQLGHADEARQWLDKATRWIEEKAPGKPKGQEVDLPVPSWGDRLEIQLLRREAEALPSRKQKG